VRWIRDYGAWLIAPGITAVADASTIATWSMTAAFRFYRGVILTAATATREWTITQGTSNAVATANTAGPIIVGILTLTAAPIVA